MRTPLNALVTGKALEFLSRVGNRHILQMSLNSITDEDLDQMPLPIKNVCTKVSVELSDRINSIIELLDISKREFCEAAFVEACDKAERIIENEGINDYLARLSEAQERAGRAA